MNKIKLSDVKSKNGKLLLLSALFPLMLLAQHLYQERDSEPKKPSCIFRLKLPNDNKGKQEGLESFSSLEPTSVTHLESPVSIGKYKVLNSDNNQTMRDVVKILIESEIIETYDHSSSDVCLISESDSKSLYRANFKASHVLYTNERFEYDYSFSVKVNKENGEVTLLPLES